MDIKTLEYMEERVKKGKELQRLIERYKQGLFSLEGGLSKVEFYTKGSGGNFRTRAKDIVDEIGVSAKEVLKKRIAELEQEFAEL